MHNFRHAVRKGEVLTGTFLAIPHPVSAEIAARSGFDFVCIDWEHSQIGRERIEDLVRALDIGGSPAIVRVPGHAPEAIAAVLDAGAQGVVVPRVSTAEQARAAVAATRFPPLGVRGAGPGRAAGYGYDIAAYLEGANDRILLAVQVETAEGLANIAEIAAVEEIDVIFVGPGDLSVSLGIPGEAGRGRLEAAIDKIAQACGVAGRTVGLFRPDATDLGVRLDAGMRFFIVASDTMFLGKALAGAAADAKAAVDAQDAAPAKGG